MCRKKNVNDWRKSRAQNGRCKNIRLKEGEECTEREAAQRRKKRRK